jgi:UDP-N-acetylglucosamine 2-epimerase (non-hydrolysing)
MRHLIHLVAGARPNFMKIAPIVRALQARAERFDWRIIHTGQHHDQAMSEVFFDELGIPPPDHRLGAGGGSHAQQTARIMLAYEPIARTERPACVIVVGDVDSTLACALVAAKLRLPVAHVEAGLRSGDRAMPEEINRLAVDAISDWLFVTEPAGRDNLLREGKPESRVFSVGHVMIDNLFFQLARLANATVDPAGGVRPAGGRYGVVTLHRPSNVDDPAALAGIVSALGAIARRLPLVFPVHPRTRASLERFGIALPPGLHPCPPQPFMAFLALWKDAALVLTDSGGLQEESTALGVPCVTLRENTERPITLEEGTNTLAGTDPAAIERAALAALEARTRTARRPALWDGLAAQRIVAQLEALLAR